MILAAVNLLCHFLIVESAFANERLCGQASIPQKASHSKPASKSTDLNIEVEQTKKALEEITAVVSDAPGGKWFCRTGSCIGYSYLVIEPLKTKFPDLHMKMRGPHAYVYRILPSGERIIIDPTWKQFYQEESVANYPDILVVHEQELVGFLHSLSDQRIKFQADIDEPLVDITPNVIQEILREIYDFGE